MKGICRRPKGGGWGRVVSFRDPDGNAINVSVSGPIEANSPMACRSAAVSGLGFAFLPDFIAEPEIRSGSLVPLLEDFTASDGGIYAVYPHRRYLPAKVRVLVDFLVQWFRDNPCEST